MLKSLLSFFFEDSSTDTFYSLYNKLVEWENKKIFPYEYELPQSILFPSEFSTKVINLYKLTRKDGLERSVSIYYVDGNLVFSSVTTGNTRFVRSNSNIKVEYKRSRNPEYYTKIIYVDNSIYSKRDIYYKRVPKSIEIKYLFNMHTHPPHKQDNLYYYSFFSATDIKSLLNTKAIMTGLITDKLIFAIRTKDSLHDSSNLSDSDITKESLTNKYKFVIYEGDFKSRLQRLSFNSNENQSRAK